MLQPECDNEGLFCNCNTNDEHNWHPQRQIFVREISRHSSLCRGCEDMKMRFHTQFIEELMRRDEDASFRQSSHDNQHNCSPCTKRFSTRVFNAEFMAEGLGMGVLNAQFMAEAQVRPYRRQQRRILGLDWC